MNYSKIIKRTKNFISPWVSIYEDNVLDANGKDDLYHTIFVYDYVCIIAIDREGYVPLVRQFRHAVNELTLELPGGLCDNDQNPKETIKKELMEETGFFSNSDLKELLSLRPCTGRLSNRCWCYYLENIKKYNNWEPEAGIDLVMTKSSELLKLIDDGHIQNSMHVSTIYKAYKEGLI